MFSNLTDQFVAISEEAVAQVQPADQPCDPELIKEQAFAVVTFLGGFLFRLANGASGMANAKQLEGYLHAVIAGVAAEHRSDPGTDYLPLGVLPGRDENASSYIGPADDVEGIGDSVQAHYRPEHRRRVYGTGVEGGDHLAELVGLITNGEPDGEFLE